MCLNNYNLRTRPPFPLPPPCFLSYFCAASECLHAVYLAGLPLAVSQCAEMLTSCAVHWAEGPYKTTQKLSFDFRAGIQTGTSRMRSSRASDAHAKLRWIDCILYSEVYPVFFLFAVWPQVFSEFATKTDVIRLCELDCLFLLLNLEDSVFLWEHCAVTKQATVLSRTVMDSALCFWKGFFKFNSVLCHTTSLLYVIYFPSILQ